MLLDLVQSLRAFRRTPTLTIIAVSTLALAFAVTSAVFSVVDKVLVRPLPIADPDRVVIWPRERANPATVGEVSYATFRKWETAAPAFERMAAMGSVNWGLVLREGDPATVPVAAVSAGFFPLLGTSALIGRTLRPEDDERHSSRVAVISHGSWQRRFGGDAAIIGRRLRFDDDLYTVVGVMVERFDYPSGAEFWVPLVPQLADSGEQWKVDVLGDPSWGVLSVTAGYFDAVGIALVRGRRFADADREDAPRVAILSERLARRLWPGQDPIGKRLLPPATTFDDTGAPRWTTVVGIVRDGRYRGLTDPRFNLYVPYRQNLDVRIKHLMVRTSGDPLALVDTIRAEARRLEPAAIVEGVTTMDRVVVRATAPWRFGASTLGILSLVALALAALGVFATVSQSVVERTREIGVRVAVGAVPRQVIHLVLREGLGLTMLGIAVGLGVAAGVVRLLGGLLFGLGAFDPLTLGAVAVISVVVSIGATVLPALRAARIDPIVALRRL